jgi:hypothetical protein
MLYDACRAEGLHGFRPDTHWTWQPTVRYHLGRRLWGTSWKHALGLMGAGRARQWPRVESPYDHAPAACQ